MKFAVNQKDFVKALSVAGKAVQTGSLIMPINGCYLLDVNKNELTVAANNMERFISCIIPCTSDDKFKIAVSYSDISFVKDLPDQPLIFEVTKSDANGSEVFDLKITAATGTYEMSAENGLDFPLMVNKTKQTFSINTSTLLEGIDKTLFACDRDVSLPLGGILLEINGNEITFTGTNKHIFSTVKLEIESHVNSKFIIPHTSASALRGLLDCDKVSIIVGSNNVGFYFENTTVICQFMLDGYPEWRNFIPLNSNKSAIIEKDVIKKSLIRSASFSNKETNRVALAFTDKQLEIRGENVDFKKSAIEKNKIEYTGEDLLIGVDAVLMATLLSNFDEDELFISMSSEMRPILIRNRKVEQQDTDNLMLVMPNMLTYVSR